MEILYTAIEEKQAELEESLLTVQQRQEHIKQSCCEKSVEDGHNFTQDDRTCMHLEELSLQEQSIQEEFNILTEISSTSGVFEDIRLAARNAHTCILEGDTFGTSLSIEEEKLSRLADKAEINYQDLVIEYKRLQKAPPENLSQEELLRLFMGHERKIAIERVRRDLFTIMAEHLLYEYNSCKSEDILHPKANGLAI